MIEHRAVELRAESESLLSGILIPYGVGSRIGEKFTETWAPGSVVAIGSEVRANVQHDRGRSVAVNRPGGGLSFTDTSTELRARIELPDTSEGRDVRVLVSRGVLSGLSAEFRARRDVWRGTDRTILEAEIRGLAIVDQPAHDGALVELEARYKSENRGAALVELLNANLPTEGDDSRPAQIAAMATAAAIDTGTVQQILAGEIDHPPAARLRGFASVLDGVSFDALVSAVVSDGANRELYEGMQQRRRVWL